MKPISLSRLTASILGAVLLLLVVSSLTPTATQAAKGGNKGGGTDPEGEKTPATIVFRDSQVAGQEDGLLSDGNLTIGPEYNHGDPNTDQMRVFIGSGGNTGNIYMQFGPDHLFPAGGSHARGLKVDFSAPDPNYDPPDAACDLVEINPGDSQDPTAGPIDITPHFNNADVSGVISGGVLGIPFTTPENTTVFAPMVIRFFDPDTGEAYFLHFGGDGSGGGKCSGDWAKPAITRTGEEEWKVNIHGAAGDRACLEKAKGTGGVKAAFCGVYHLPAEYTLTPCPTCPPAP